MKGFDYMNYITILTPDNIEIEYRLAGPGSRTAAMVIDLLLQCLAMVAVYVIALYTLMDGSLVYARPEQSAWFAAIIIFSVFVIFYGYYVVAEVSMNGRTIGKKILGLRVIRENGAPITLTQSLIRNIIKLFIDMSGVGVITIMFSKKCKRLGDMAASTIVIAENSSKVAINSVTAGNWAGGSPKPWPTVNSVTVGDLSDSAPKSWPVINSVTVEDLPDSAPKPWPVVNSVTTGDLADSMSIPESAIDNMAVGYMADNKPQPEPAVNDEFIIDDRELRLLRDYFARRGEFTDVGMSVLSSFEKYFAKKFSVPESTFTEDVLLEMIKKR